MGKIRDLCGFFRLFLPLRPAQALHPISISTEVDGMKIACWAQTLHPISVPTESDGMTAQKRSNLLHPSTL